MSFQCPVQHPVQYSFHPIHPILHYDPSRPSGLSGLSVPAGPLGYDEGSPPEGPRKPPLARTEHVGSWILRRETLRFEAKTSGGFVVACLSYTCPTDLRRRLNLATLVVNDTLIRSYILSTPNFRAMSSWSSNLFVNGYSIPLAFFRVYCDWMLSSIPIFFRSPSAVG